MLSSRRNVRFHISGMIGCQKSCSRRGETLDFTFGAFLQQSWRVGLRKCWDIFGLASFTNALPVPMLGQVGWCFRRGETLIFGVWVLKVVLPSRRNAHFRILGHLKVILGYLGSILGHLGAILGHLGAILGHLGAILGHLGAI